MKKVLIFLLLPLTMLGQTYDVLFLGNSYTGFNNLPLMVSEIALSLGDTVNYDSSTPGGCTLQGHTTNTNSLNKISQEPWDFVVIQAQSQEPSFPPSQVASNTYPYAQVLVDSILANDSCTEPIFFMTWGRKNGDAANAGVYPIIGTYLGMQWRLRESYLEMGFTHDATVAPVGMSWKKSIQTDPVFELYTADESHPNVAGSYLAACTFYSTIFNESCVGASYYPSSLTAAEAAYLQDIASSTVLDSTAVWNILDIQSIHALGDITFAFNSEVSNADGYYWEFGDGSTSADQNTTYTYLNFGTYYEVYFTAYSNGGCRSITDTISVYTQNPESVEDMENIKVYPNPIQDALYVEFNEVLDLFLFNIKGEKVLEVINFQETQLDLSHLPKGAYLLKISTDRNHTEKHIKIIKE